MNTNKIDISKLIDTYSKHEWIDLSEYPEYPIDDNTAPVELNLHCKNIIKEWLEIDRGLSSQEGFPFSGEIERDRLVSKLVNGFCLNINNGDGIISKIVFIPSEQIDIDSCEIAQEWVDLKNWMSDYYVPIQVDVDEQHLHLWGMITHQELKQMKEPDDKKFRYYNVDTDRMVDNLEVLWTSCELAPDPRSINIPELVTQGVTGFIDRVKSEAGSNFDRLILQFNEWGAILNDQKYLENYLNSVQSVHNPKPENEIIIYIDSLINAGWQLLNNYLCPPQGVPHMNLPINVCLEAVKGLSLRSPEGIKTAVTNVYHQQNDIPLPNEIIGVEDLIPVLKSCKDDKIWWQAAEYLWAIKPDLSPSTAVIRELDPQFVGRKIGLMIATIKTPHDRLAVLVRLYPTDGGTFLPPRLQLSVRDESGVNFLVDSQGKPIVVTARTDIKDSSIQLYFGADSGDRFSSCISLDSTEVVENFPLPQSHPI